jgi:hypothetical protein
LLTAHSTPPVPEEDKMTTTKKEAREIIELEEQTLSHKMHTLNKNTRI